MAKKLQLSNEFGELIEDKLANQIMVTGSDATITTTADSVWTKLDLNSVSSSCGNKLTLNTTNKEIVVGSGVNYISVSCGCTVILNSSGMTYQSVSIRKNGSNWGPYTQSRGSYSPSIQPYMVLSEILIPVQQGDKISMAIYNRLAGNITVGRIYMSVKVVK